MQQEEVEVFSSYNHENFAFCSHNLGCLLPFGGHIEMRVVMSLQRSLMGACASMTGCGKAQCKHCRFLMFLHGPTFHFDHMIISNLIHSFEILFHMESCSVYKRTDISFWKDFFTDLQFLSLTFFNLYHDWMKEFFLLSDV